MECRSEKSQYPRKSLFMTPPRSPGDGEREVEHFTRRTKGRPLQNHSALTPERPSTKKLASTPERPPSNWHLFENSGALDLATGRPKTLLSGTETGLKSVGATEKAVKWTEALTGISTDSTRLDDGTWI
jgi:hypothetical protein